jgi:hypothetical protein
MTVKLICPYCRFSKKIPKEKIPAGARWATCPSCGQRFEFSVPGRDIVPEIGEPGADSTFKEHKRKGAPWESRSELGLWHGIYDTFKAVLFSPGTFFSSVSLDGGIKEPLAFGILVGSFGRMFGVFWNFLIFSGSLLAIGQSVFSNVTVGLIFLFIIVMIPFFLILCMFIYSGILHLLLLIVGGGKNHFEATFRVVSYSQATQAWVLIPFIGGWIGGIWQFVVQIIGLREIHQTSYSRVIIAFLIPVALLLLVTVAVLIPIFIYMSRHWLG